MKEYYSVLQVVQRCAGRITWTARGKPLADDDQSTLEFALVCWGCLLHDILPHDEVIRSYCGFFQKKECDTAVLVRTLKGYKDLLLSMTKCNSSQCTEMVSRFKHERAGETMYHGLMTPVRPLFDAYALNHESATFGLLFQWLTFLEHLNLHSLDLTVEGEADYVAFEEEVPTWEYPDDLCALLRYVLTQWFQDFHFDGFHARFGPGAVAETNGRVGTRIKCSQLGTDPMLQYFISRLPDGRSFLLDETVAPLVRCNEIVFVPKSLDKNRIISKEPTALGYLQHGVQDAMYRYTYTRKDLRARFDFRDQSRSRDLARQGSLSGEYATLDLSSASDSVTTSLVKRVFTNPDLRRGLLCTRSRSARLPSGRVIPLSKFAPMGSATCFPVETYIFGGLCEVAAWLEWGRASYDNDYMVYGDDIVVKSALVPVLLQLLDAFHFTVNTSKSYYYTGAVPIFREACGGFYLSGRDVTPLRLSRKLHISRRAADNAVPSTREALVTLANEAYLRGFRTLRFGVLTCLKSAYPEFSGILFCTPDYEGSDRVITDYGCDSNWNLKSRRSHVDHVSTEVKCITTSSHSDDALISRNLEAFLSDRLVYDLWLCDRASRVYDRDGLPSVFDASFGVEYAPEKVQLDPRRSRERWNWVTCSR